MLLRRVDAFATAEGVTRSRAVRELTGMGLDMVESQKGIPMGRVEEILNLSSLSPEWWAQTGRNAGRPCRRRSASCGRRPVDRVFRGVLRNAQGVYAVHQHGGLNRQSHPHVHVQLSPRFRDGTPIHISPERIAKLKLRWEHEVLRELDRRERRLVREPARLTTKLREARERESKARPRRVDVWRELVWRLRPYRRRRVLPGFGLRLPVAVRAKGPGQEMAQNPERVVRRVVLNLAAKALPKPFREALELGRTLTRIGR
jgi:hypothetical protein